MATRKIVNYLTALLPKNPLKQSNLFIFSFNKAVYNFHFFPQLKYIYPKD